MLANRQKPMDLETAKEFFKTYKNRPALLVKDHPELKLEITEKINLSNNYEELDYFAGYNDWLLDWCLSCLE